MKKISLEPAYAQFYYKKIKINKIKLMLLTLVILELLSRKKEKLKDFRLIIKPLTLPNKKGLKNKILLSLKIDFVVYWLLQKLWETLNWLDR
jgi:hypothetical protein